MEEHLVLASRAQGRRACSTLEGFLPPFLLSSSYNCRTNGRSRTFEEGEAWRWALLNVLSCCTRQAGGVPQIATQREVKVLTVKQYRHALPRSHLASRLLDQDRQDQDSRTSPQPQFVPTQARTRDPLASVVVVRGAQMQGALAGGFAVAYFGLHWDGGQLLAAAVAVLFLLSVDQVANGGGFEALAVDVARRAVQQEYGRRVALHEAGHFLIAYLVGILPRRYTLSSLDAFRK